MKKDLNQLGQATKWSGITEIATRLVSPITNAILARLLAPEAFGVVATLTMVVSFAEIFTDAGFQKYLIQHEFQDEEDLDLSTNVAFWTNILFSLFVWGIIAVFATPIANLVGSPGHELAIIVISAEIPLLAFSSIQLARFRRDFAFKNLFVIRMLVSMVPLVITVPAAFLFKSYWALVVGTLAKDVLNAVALMLQSRWKPKFAFSLQKLKDMISFSMWTVVENVSIWLTTNVGTFIIGNMMGSYYLGLFKTTTTTVAGYFNIIQGTTMPVLFSALSRCQDDEKEFREVFFKFQRMAALIVFPLGFGIMVYHNLATLILLGDQWLETAPFFGMRSVAQAMLLIFSYFNSEAFRSKGQPKLSVLVQCLYLVTLIPTLVWSSNESFAVLSVASSLVCVMMIVFSSAVSQKLLGIRFASVLKNVWPSLVSSTVMAAAGVGFLLVSDHIVWQVASVFLCMIVYAAAMVTLPAGRKQLQEVPVLSRFIKTN